MSSYFMGITYNVARGLLIPLIQEDKTVGEQ